MKRVFAFGLEWHKNKSNAFKKLLIDPLKEYIEIKFNVWDGDNLKTVYSSDDILIFCQNPPPEFLMNEPHKRMLWIPMWDHSFLDRQSFWNALPRNLKIVAYSKKIENKAVKAGLTTLSLKYYPDPKEISVAPWNEEKVLFYWNRTGLINVRFIEKICRTLQLDRLLFLSKTDPGSELYKYDVANKIGATEIEAIPYLSDPSEFERILQRTNITIAPRAIEGVGITFLDQYARGCAVFSYNGTTMDEYITHKLDGYFFKSSLKSRFNELMIASGGLLQKIALRLSRGPLNAINHPSIYQNWHEISSLDLKQLGTTARLKSEDGYNRWKDQLIDYFNFITEW